MGLDSDDAGLRPRKTPVFRKYEDQLMFCLMMLPLVLLVVGLVGSLIVLWRKKRASGQNPGKGA